MNLPGKRIPITLLSFAVLIVVWSAAARIVNAPLILPTPSATFATLVRMARTGMFWMNVGATCFRCIISFAVSVVFGTLIGTLCGLFPPFGMFCEVPVAVVRATPVISFILLALFWFKSDNVPIFVSVLMTLPVMITAVSSGFQKKGRELPEMASVYRLTRWQQFRYITLPEVRPFFLSGCVSSFGLTWKVVAAGEVLSLPHFGAGTLLQTAQVHLETAQVLAVTIVVVGISFSVEKLATYFITGTKTVMVREEK